MTTTLVELCAGTASVSLWALGQVGPLTGFMGSKRRWAPFLVDLLGVANPDRVVLVDAGPWGDVWTVLRNEGVAAVANALRSLVEAHSDDATIAWPVLSRLPPPSEPAQRAAQFLVLQGRTPNNIPIWWDGIRWTGPTGSRTEEAHMRGGRSSREAGPATVRVKRGSGLVRISTLVERVIALDLSRVDVVHGDVRGVQPIPGAVVYVDPPYVRAPRYAALLPRVDVLSVARRWAAAGCRVLVSEGEPLPVAGWTALPLPRSSREWVTASWRVPVPPQLALPCVAA